MNGNGWEMALEAAQTMKEGESKLREFIRGWVRGQKIVEAPGMGLGGEVLVVTREGRQVTLDKPVWDAVIRVAQAAAEGDMPANVRSNIKLFLQKVGGGR